MVWGLAAEGLGGKGWGRWLGMVWKGPWSSWNVWGWSGMAWDGLGGSEEGLGRVWRGSGEGLGRVWGGSGEGLERVWRGSGKGLEPLGWILVAR